MSMDTLGVDIGGVIISRAVGPGDTSLFGERFLDTAPVAGAFDVLCLLVQRFEGRVHLVQRFEGRVHLVSKCGPRIQDRTRRWLLHSGFHDHVGIREDHVRYCLARIDKAPICAELSVTHFIDDTLEVLNYMTDVEHRYLFDPARKQECRLPRRVPHQATGIRRVESWTEIADCCWPRRDSTPRPRRGTVGPR